jgi:hypothetical protein
VRLLATRQVENKGVGAGVIVSSGWWLGLKELSVGVVVFDGLEWVLAWRQLRVKIIRVEIVTETGREQMVELMHKFRQYLKDIHVVNSCADFKLDLITTVISLCKQARAFRIRGSGNYAIGFVHCSSSRGPILWCCTTWTVGVD